MALEEAIVPRRLAVRIDPFSDSALLGPGELVEDLQPAFDADTRHSDERLWDAMRRSELAISAAEALRVSTVTSKGGAFQAGDGDRADLLRRIAQRILMVKHWPAVQKEIVGTWGHGWNVHEAVGLRRFVVDNRECAGPVRLERRNLWNYGFDRESDLVLRANGTTAMEDKTFRTSNPAGHRDALKWMVSRWGDSGDPYGKAVYGDVWLAWSQLRSQMRDMNNGLRRMNACIKITQTLAGTGSRHQTAQLESSERLAKRMVEVWTKTGVLQAVGGMTPEVLDVKAPVEAWIAAIDKWELNIRIRILGSHLAQSQPDQGARAAAETHALAVESFGKTDAEAAAENIDSYVHGWLRWNFSGEELDDEEMPRYRFVVGNVPTLEHVQAMADVKEAEDDEVGVDALALAELWHVPLVVPDGTGPLILGKSTGPMPPALAAAAGVEVEDDEESEEPPTDDDSDAEE